MPLEHIEEGYAYHDGETRKLYDAADPASAEAVLLEQCVSYSVGPLTIKGCLDFGVPSVSVTATLLGVVVAGCTLTVSNPSCTFGASVDGVKAEVTVTFQPSPPTLTISGEVCYIVGCKKFSHTIHFAALEDA